MSAAPFLDRVFTHLPRIPIARGGFEAWSFQDRPTQEGVGVVPLRADPARMAARILDVGHYTGNVEHVVESRVIADAGLPSGAVRFYQRLKIPVLGEMQMELVLTDHGDRDGWRVLAWHQLDDATLRLDPARGARTEYNLGAWLLRADAVGYALASAPRRDDVGRLKFAALTTGADAAAHQMVKANIEGMARWAARA